MDDKVTRQAVIDALDYDPGIDGADIGVACDKGIVTLSGHVRSYVEKVQAERVAAQVKGVRAIALDIEIRYPADLLVADDQIAERALKILSWDVLVPAHSVFVEVEKGWVTLNGEVTFQFQKTGAEKAIRRLGGVTGVTNKIALKARPKPVDVRDRILAALKRSAELDANAIRVEVHDDRVVLEGKVKAWHERDVAERAAWAAPGVRTVEDRLSVG